LVEDAMSDPAELLGIVGRRVRRIVGFAGPPVAVICLAAVVRWLAGAAPYPVAVAAVATDAGATGTGAGAALVAALRAGKVVDLTHTFDATTVYWPTEDGFQLEPEHHGLTDGGYWYESNRLATAEHGGTHMDAPAHFAEGNRTAEKVPLDSLIGPAVVVDVTEAVAADRDYRLQVGDLTRWEAKHGRIPAGAIVIMRTGFGDRWPDKKRYLGTAKKGDVANLHFPGFSQESAEWLVRERDVAAIGLDTASIDYGPSKDFIVHRVVNGADKPGFENLANLGRLPESGATIVALPMKIGGGSGGPLRAIAILP
jgi:kynurenine formamidase